MLQSVGVQWALAGHSERRVIFGESDEYINGQVLKLLDLGMSCMLCIGESDSEYEQNLAGAVCAVQLKKGLAGVSKEDMSKIVIAYEPVWAIGTGKVAKVSDIAEMHGAVRALLVELTDEVPAQNISLLYGGSVNSENVSSIVDQENVDGILVGGASVSMETFGTLLENLAGRRQ